MSSSKRTRSGAENKAGSSTPLKKYRLDVDNLECPICTDLFSPPVFQCNNGHTACSNCCKKLNARGCPSCSLPIGHIRCLAIEKVVESLWVECELGCGTALRFCDREEHERSMCHHRPLKCSMPDCALIVPRYAISGHFWEAHNIPNAHWWGERSASFEMGVEQRDLEEKSVLLQDKDAWFVVKIHTDPRGHRFTCDPIWTSKVVVVKLSVHSFSEEHNRVYSMTTSLLAGDLQQYLLVPGPDKSFDVSVTMM